MCCEAGTIVSFDFDWRGSAAHGLPIVLDQLRHNFMQQSCIVCEPQAACLERKEFCDSWVLSGVGCVPVKKQVLTAATVSAGC